MDNPLISPAYTAYLLVAFISAVIMAALAFYSWSHRTTPGATLFTWLMVDFAFTSLCYVFMGVSQSPELFSIWARLRFLGLSTIPVLFLLFVLGDRGNETWVRRAPLFLIVPLLIQILIWTNDSHHLFFAQWSYHSTGYALVEDVKFGDGIYLHGVYSLLLISIGALLLLERVLNSRGLYRKQAALLLTGSILATAINLLFTLRLLPREFPNPTPFGFLAAALFFTVALFRYRLFDLVPVAFDTVYESMKDPVFVFNDQKRVVAINPAAEKLMLKNESELLGKHASEVFFRFPELLEQYGDMIEGHAEILLGMKNDERTYDLRISPIYQRRNQLAGRLVVLRDITERKLAEKRNFQLTIEREKTRLLASFIQYSSHDLRTPLSKMNMSVYIAQRTNDPKQRQDSLNAISDEIVKMATIIQELHLLTKLDSGLTFDLQPISMDNVVQGTPNDIQRMLKEKNQTFHISGEPNITIRGDVELLRHALYNLLHNAVVYTPAAGSITVNTCRMEKWGVIQVTDTGVGIEDEKLGAIFERFVKANSARTADESGAGLGLSITKKIMDLHHGKVTVTSNPGQGSTFSLMLPLGSNTPTLRSNKVVVVSNSQNTH